MASSATLLSRILTRASNPIPIPSSIRSFSSTFYQIVKPSPQRARDDAPDHLHRSGLLINDEDDALYLTKSMPGLGVEDIHVEINKNNTLIIKGSPGGYETVLNLPPSCRKEEGRFIMKNGVLRVKVPKEHKPNGPNDQAQSGESPCIAEEYKRGDAVVIVGYQLQDE
ncbi:hypothetical protein ACLB2K_000965 [Fragaria x ananassa]